MFPEEAAGSADGDVGRGTVAATGEEKLSSLRITMCFFLNRFWLGPSPQSFDLTEFCLLQVPDFDMNIFVVLTETFWAKITHQRGKQTERHERVSAAIFHGSSGVCSR